MSDGLKKFDESIADTTEKKQFDDLIVLGNAVPDEISDGRKTVCAVAFSPTDGLIRIYPIPPKADMKRWNIISVPLERNPRDNRNESWKIQGSKDDWNNLHNKIKVKGKLSRSESIELIEKIKLNHSYNCIEDINDKQLSLGIIIPNVLDKKFEARTDVDPTIQSTLTNLGLFKTINNYDIRPVITYSCPNCRTKKRRHTQGVLEWGLYEGMRKGFNEEQIWKNLHLDDPDYDRSFLVGNMNSHRRRFLIISVFRFKRDLASQGSQSSL